MARASGAGEKADKAARGSEPNRGGQSAGENVGHSEINGEPALRKRSPVNGMRAAPGEGHRFRVRANNRSGRKRRQGPQDDAAHRSGETAPGSFGEDESAARPGSGGWIWKGLPAV